MTTKADRLGAVVDRAADDARAEALDDVVKYCRDRAAALSAGAGEAGSHMAAQLLLRADECAFLARACRAMLNRG